ncbi:MAG: ATP-binding cassette domain-containing protein [Clostridia bacterium]|nr:ATP-binding cassette domain-containing protein [Clostridia bacterium]
MNTSEINVSALELFHVSKVKPVLLGNAVTELDVIHDVTITVSKGEILTLIGPSGSGKSTFLRMLNRLEDPSSGQIRLFGEDIAGIDLRDLRRRVGMVSQTPALLAGSVASNVSYGPRLRGLPCDLGRYLDMVGLERGLLDRPASTLSIGQQQRMAIARALANEPEVLLLDEPTSALDQTASRNILDLICTLNRELGLTAVMVTHIMDHARAVATSVVLLVGGAVVEVGRAAEFFSGPSTEIGRRFLRGELVADER